MTDAEIIAFIVDITAEVADVPHTGPHNLISNLIGDFARYRGRIEAAVARGTATPLSAVTLRPPLPQRPRTRTKGHAGVRFVKGAQRVRKQRVVEHSGCLRRDCVGRLQEKTELCEAATVVLQHAAGVQSKAVRARVRTFSGDHDFAARHSGTGIASSCESPEECIAIALSTEECCAPCAASAAVSPSARGHAPDVGFLLKCARST